MQGKKAIHTSFTRFLLMAFLAFGRFIPITTIPERQRHIMLINKGMWVISFIKILCQSPYFKTATTDFNTSFYVGLKKMSYQRCFNKRLCFIQESSATALMHIGSLGRLCHMELSPNKFYKLHPFLQAISCQYGNCEKGLLSENQTVVWMFLSLIFL